MSDQPHFDPKKNHPYHPGTITRIIKYLRGMGIKSREDFLARFDDHATAKQLEALDGIGPAMAKQLVWLRGQTIDEWRKLTNMPAFNTPAVEAGTMSHEGILQEIRTEEVFGVPEE